MRRFVQTGIVVLAITAGAVPAAAQNLSGTGQQATDLFPLTEGLATFDVEHQGSGTFTIRLLDDQGMLIEQLAQGEGAFRGSKAVRVPRSGQYLYDVSASGPWSVQLRQSATAGTAAGATGTPTTGMVSDSVLRSRGKYNGEQEANRIGGLPYMLGGLVGGMAAGPIGAGAVFMIAAGRSATMPEHTQSTLAEREPAYVEAYTDAFQQKLRANRRTAAVVGGVTGTGVFFFVIAQILNWGDTGGDTSTPPGGGEVP
jgi:hypothetical protein